MDGADRFRRWVATIPPLAWAAVMLLLAVALGVAARTIGAVERFDAEVVRELQGEVGARGLQEQVFAVTDLAGSPMLLAGIAVVATLLLVGRWRAALVVTLAVALTKVAVAVVKEIIQRPRPETAFEAHGTFSFPSGHAASAAALYMTLAVLLSRDHRAGVRAIALSLGALVTVAVGASRVFLGAHFPTDVLAGWLVGGLLALCAWALVVRFAGHPPRPAESARARLKDIVAARDDAAPEQVPEDMRI